MEEQIEVQRLLLRKFKELQMRNPSYSMRAFARKLGLNSGALSAILGGKRRVSVKLTQKIALKLMLDPQERSELLRGFERRRLPIQRNDSVDPNYLQLTADQFRMISEWPHLALLSLMNTQEFKSDPAWIAQRLGLTKAAVLKIIERLKRLELIEETSQRKLKRSATRFRTTDDVTNLSIQKSHQEGLELAAQSLQHDPVEARDFTSITMAIDPEKLKIAKEKIRNFQDELSEILETGKQSEVYRLCIQLFPLSKGESK